MSYPGFEMYGLQISAVFDINKKIIGREVHGVTVENVSKLPSLKNRNIYLGIIAVPAENAQEIADKLVEAGIKGILNFAPTYPKVPKKVKVITNH